MSISSSSMACFSPPLLTRTLVPSTSLNFGPANNFTFRKANLISNRARSLCMVKCDGEKPEDCNSVSVSDATTHHQVIL